MLFTAEQTKFVKAIWRYCGCVTGRHQGKKEDKDFVLSRLASTMPNAYDDLFERADKCVFQLTPDRLDPNCKDRSELTHWSPIHACAKGKYGVRRYLHSSSLLYSTHLWISFVCHTADRDG